MSKDVYLIVHNVRSAHNVGSILRTADCLGAYKVYLTGYTPYPLAGDDSRLPHAARRTDKKIAKTALGAEKSVGWSHEPDVMKLVSKLKARGIIIAALEQTPHSFNLSAFKPRGDVALIAGSEIGGIEPELLAAADTKIQITMRGKKESLNVAVAAAIALYHLRN